MLCCYGLIISDSFLGSADGDVAENTIDHDASGFENLYMSLRYGWQDDDEDHAKEKTAGSGESAP